MRVGSIKWNFIVAGMIGGFTLLFSLMNNLFWESLLRSLLAFLLFFLLMFLFRYLAGKAVGKEALQHIPSETKGRHVDLITPEDLEYERSQQSGEDESREKQPSRADFSQFTATDFPTITRSNRENINPEEIARALRVFSDE
ncbi:hypothetical protein P4S93_08780 [Aneurinibacillus thermoaerophilus]|uniref:Uncharacterized protein n=2 Tax=Aneurinibacillus TaxID=55079 RepID=A0ABX8Y7V3_ANETH|nr:hypothetical protein [Aneurinibacillus thermoaerophilus]AMA72692.1 hypothetical protein ACH33_07385 [Aneurinibacillus sp. XH2]MED0674589.1 hypothetical protein [Aneurinibacillus thermoaerophilus]MED0677958.1 hypothetical protein [Aneurinibacillus thermoaerophilus]MED0756820.1 hypothetical protein [Aneurinibacillus thermoaerophilus]MED0760870.1 hypothetical protein [Aneurinibacillus thermoaerophilus]